MAALIESSFTFKGALRELMAERDLSFRKLEDLTDKRADRKLGQAYLNQLAMGRSKPTVENMRTIAEALDIDPRYFREYREHLAAERAAQLTRSVGLDEVLAALDELAKQSA